MKRKIIIGVLWPVSLAAVGGACAWAAFALGAVKGKGQGVVLSEMAEAGVTVAVLRELREGDTETAAQLLETQLDGDIIMMGNPGPVDPEIGAAIGKLLSIIRDYRLRHPRDWSKAMRAAGGHEDNVENTEHVRDEVERVLKEAGGG